MPSFSPQETIQRFSSPRFRSFVFGGNAMRKRNAPNESIQSNSRKSLLVVAPAPTLAPRFLKGRGGRWLAFLILSAMTTQTATTTSHAIVSFIVIVLVFEKECFASSHQLNGIKHLVLSDHSTKRPKKMSKLSSPLYSNHLACICYPTQITSNAKPELPFSTMFCPLSYFRPI